MIQGRRPLPGLLSWLPAVVREAVSFILYTLRRFLADNCLQTASALTFSSLLAVVPLMTIGFAIFSAFPAFQSLQSQAQEMIITNLVPAVSDAILQYVDQFTQNAGQLTAVGIVGLAATSVITLATIDGAFNAIWRSTEPRPLVTRLLSFWAILTVAPLLFGASLSLSGMLFGSLRRFGLSEFTGPLAGVGFLLPGLFELLGLTLLYAIMPSRSVLWRDAALGGLVAAILLELSKTGFGLYIAAFPSYQAIYGAIATIPIFLLWLYIVWSTILFGGEVTAALPEWRAGKITKIGPEGLLPAQRLAVALGVLHELLAASQYGVGLRAHTLAKRVPVGRAVIDGIIEQLRQSHWVARTSKNAWVVTRDLDTATLYDLLKAMGVGLRGTVRGVGGMHVPWQDRCAALLEAAEESERDLLCISLKELFAEPKSEDVPRRAARRG